MSVHAIAVGYRNTLPLREGLRDLERTGALTLALDRPSAATRRFARGEFVLGLLPVAAQFSIPEAVQVGKHGIVADGFVGSVGIFAERPLADLDAILLDHDSRSSVLLARVLLKHHWRLGTMTRRGGGPRVLPAEPGYRARLGGGVGGVIIGDPAIAARSRFAYYYDLAEAWRAMTGLPFVFAAWLSAIPLARDFVEAFDAAQARGVASRLEVAAAHQGEVPTYDLAAYFTQQIHYTIDARAARGMRLFLRLSRELLAEEALQAPRAHTPTGVR